MPEFRALKPAQKLQWQTSILPLADEVMRAGAKALKPITAEILKFEDEHKNSYGKEHASGKLEIRKHPSLKLSWKIIFPTYAERDSLTWTNVSDAELKPLMDRISALKSNQTPPPKRRIQAKKIKR